MYQTSRISATKKPLAERVRAAAAAVDRLPSAFRTDPEAILAARQSIVHDLRRIARELEDERHAK